MIVQGGEGGGSVGMSNATNDSSTDGDGEVDQKHSQQEKGASDGEDAKMKTPANDVCLNDPLGSALRPDKVHLVKQRDGRSFQVREVSIPKWQFMFVVILTLIIFFSIVTSASMTCTSSTL